MFTDKITKLKNRINAYIESGGSIYDTKKELPYYEYMGKTKRRMEEYYNITLTMEYMYSLCGFKFDREFNNYNLICEQLSKFADKNGCVDVIRTSEYKKKDGVYHDLKNVAAKQNVSLIDYLFFMTPYHFSTGRISIDNISKLKKDLLKVYPTRDLTGIRWDNPKLYERIRSLRFAMPERLSMQEVIQFLGFANDKFSNTLYNVKASEKEVLKELIDRYPDKEVSGITKDASTLYYKVVKLAFDADLAIEQWLELKGFKFITSNKGTRLSSTQVTFDERVEELQPLKKKYEKKLLKPNMDEIEKYYAKISIMQKSLEEYESTNSSSLEL